jgi:hypothetical protein
MSKDDFIQQFAKINMLNIVVGSVLAVWVIGSLRVVLTAPSDSLNYKDALVSLKEIMLIVLGYYLKVSTKTGSEDK